ncbi:hypothetical protein NC796_13835 [Aliifodinibius sp. S!AR15-10]|uniref:hypothetical protein n=1 Tax=Aliifodinibius sp. S!AR15-10 TaxID=2950437 RepID=UPI0028594C73|nr:hypothetical protein [Aliifodinibius sp. S!AR15-10]MDR8392229.1 hypothetical protein [Aliifodinibius sp. S!AR15-10]
MSLAPEDKADLLRFTSHSRRNSNAYLDTISNAALIAFLQFEQVKGQIESQPKTSLAIDIFLDFLVGIAINTAGSSLVKSLVGKMVGRVVNSRFVVGKFMNTVPAGNKSNTIILYKNVGISKRLNFDSYTDFLKAHRIEKANISRIQYGANLAYNGLLAPKVRAVVANAGKSKNSSSGKLGISETISIVDSAMAYAVNQKVLNDIMFDELENVIRLDLLSDPDSYNDIFKRLKELHHPLSHQGEVISLDTAREQLIWYFEFILWAITFSKVYKSGVIKLESTHNDPRLKLFDDIGKDHTLTKYLVNRLGENRHLFKYNEKIYHRADYLRIQLRQAGKIANEKKVDFGNLHFI